MKEEFFGAEDDEDDEDADDEEDEDDEDDEAQQGMTVYVSYPQRLTRDRHANTRPDRDRYGQPSQEHLLDDHELTVV